MNCSCCVSFKKLEIISSNQKFKTLFFNPNLLWFLGQLWKVNGTRLSNRGNIWNSNDQWNFGNKTDLIHIIENTSKSKVLGTTSDGEVIEEDFDGNRTEQLWVKGEPNNEGYFTVTTSESKLLLSAISSESLEVKGISN